MCLNSVHRIYHAQCLSDLEHSVQEMRINFAYMDTVLDHYYVGDLKYMLNKCFVPAEDQYLLAGLQSTT